jgi:hypothetical protein
MATNDISTRQDFGQASSADSVVRWHNSLAASRKPYAPVAQLDRAPDFESLPAFPEPLGNSHNPRNHWGVRCQSMSLNAADDAPLLALSLAQPSCTKSPIRSLHQSTSTPQLLHFPWVTSRFPLRSVHMNVSSLVRLSVVVGLLSSVDVAAQPFDISTAPHSHKPECVGFNAYTWTREQIEACIPGSWPVDSGFNPYNPSNQPIFTPTKVQAFANVLAGLPGLENDYWAFLTLENDTEANTAHVIVRGGVQEIHRFVQLAPGARKVEQLNAWPELAHQLPIGVSVRVRWMKEGNAGVAMHRARDFGSMVQAVEGGGTK